MSGRAEYSFLNRNSRKGIDMPLFSKVNVCFILIAMAFSVAPAATYAAAFVKLGDIKGEVIKMPVTDKTTVREVAKFAARQAGVDVDQISVSWRGKELDRRRTLGSYRVQGKKSRKKPIRGDVSGDPSAIRGVKGPANAVKPASISLNFEEIKVTLKSKLQAVKGLGN